MVLQRRLIATSPTARPNVLSGPPVVPNVLRGTAAAPASTARLSLPERRRRADLTRRRAGPPPVPIAAGRAAGGLLAASPAPGRPTSMPGQAALPDHPGDFRTNPALRVAWRLGLGAWTGLLALGVAGSAIYGSPEQRTAAVVVLALSWWLSLPLVGLVVRPLTLVLDPLARAGPRFGAQAVGFIVAGLAVIVAQSLIVAALTASP